MKLHILFGQRKCSYEGEYAPETLVCWDEFSVDDNPEGFDEEVAEAEKANASEMSAMRVITVEVDGNKIDKLLNQPPVVKGEVIDT